MIEYRLITEEDLLKKYVAGQAMKKFSEEDQTHLAYAVGQPLKSSPIGRASDTVKSLEANVLRSLWEFRNNQEFYAYQNSEDKKLRDAIGLYFEDELEATEAERTHNDHRCVSFGYRPEKNKEHSITQEKNLVYIPPMNGLIKPGVLTDLIKAYRTQVGEMVFDESFKKACENEEPGTWEYHQRRFANQASLSVLNAGIIFPHYKGNKGYLERIEESTIEDKVGFATQLIRDNTPERLEDFTQAVK